MANPEHATERGAAHQQVFSQVETLTSALGEVEGIVAVDGVDRSGKTTLCEGLSMQLEASHLRVDSYLNRNRGPYLDHL